MKQLLFLFVLYLSVTTTGQVTNASLPLHSKPGSTTGTNGIQWTTNLSWAQVQEKARQENKYIFLDCFATWCGPCKVMDQQVYTDEEVGSYFNDKFISVRVQMDKTEKDDAPIQSWYPDAAALGKQYHVEGYPTFLFFSPQGTIVSKEMGGMPKQAFMAMTQKALVPGKVYEDPYAVYKKLKEDYRQGIKNYDSFPYIIQMAYKAGEQDFGKQLLDEHTLYIMNLQPEQWYTKENIELWSSFMLKSSGQRFRFFYKDGDKIDQVMQEKGFAAKVVDRTIWNEIVSPFLEEQATGSGVVMHGMYLGGPGASQLKADSSEADWKKLEKLIRQPFNTAIAKRNVVAAKLEWYKRHRNQTAYTKCYMVKLEKYTHDYNEQLMIINEFIWDTFIHITDQKLLAQVIPWGAKAVALAPQLSMLLDSYANLLYKAGRKEEAIEWQTKAVALTPADKEMEAALQHMRKNEPTYIHQGAIWKNERNTR